MTAHTRPERWELALYVAGNSGKSKTAISNINRYCEKYLHEKYEIEVIDLLKYPHRAEDDQILAIPTLVRKVPAPIRKIIGDLSNEAKVLSGLEVRPVIKNDKK
jgi:circadian clock protein KaiB